MKREVDINEISDGKRYKSGDMVKISCNDCIGCKESCCYGMNKTIILDPYDMYQLQKGCNLSFDELLAKEYIELSMQDNLIIPNLKMNEATNGCSFLAEGDRCSIHDFRPGFCRLFPLGRIYEEGHFDYFIQIHECDYPNKSKIKVKKWIGIEGLREYEEFVLKWHDFIEKLRDKLKSYEDMNEVSVVLTRILVLFFKEPYDVNISFYEQIEKRFESFQL